MYRKSKISIFSFLLDCSFVQWRSPSRAIALPNLCDQLSIEGECIP
ncbi:hypothetical protein H6F61_21370 [Cyanobacteria bacterium FACHB-472]|nr:hypothetical protein [Cyanobacteria bacterium FACHB-472]